MRRALSLLALLLLFAAYLPAAARATGVAPLGRVTGPEPAPEGRPALASLPDGTLYAVWTLRVGGLERLWGSTSADGGGTWAAPQPLTSATERALCPALLYAGGKLWLFWEFQGPRWGIWGQRSDDGGATWGAPFSLTPTWETAHEPTVSAAPDGTLYLLYHSLAGGQNDLWLRLSTDGGLTWPTRRSVTNTPAAEGPATLVADGGGLLVAWEDASSSPPRLLAAFSTDQGASWSSPAPLLASGAPETSPALARDESGRLWLAWADGSDVFYATSASLPTWSVPLRFSAYAGWDGAPALAKRGASGVALAFLSARDLEGALSLWCGLPGEREDVAAPPYVYGAAQLPAHPVAGDGVTITAHVAGPPAAASVALVWQRDGLAQPELVLYDDGAHGDGAAGDGLYGTTLASLPAGSDVTFQVRAASASGAASLTAVYGFRVLAQFVKEHNILLVIDQQPDEPDATRFYTATLAALGWGADLWQVAERGALPEATLLSYASPYGTVIWAAPNAGLVSDPAGSAPTALQGFLQAGGRLFLTGQNIAEGFSMGNGAGFLRDYLHAALVQPTDAGLWRQGVADDPIGAGLFFRLSGGDGSGSRNYGAGDELSLASPALPVLLDPAGSSPANAVTGLRVAENNHRVVFFSFAWDAIDSALDREAVLARVLAWLLSVPPGGVTLSAPAGALTADEVRLEARVQPLSTTLPLTYTWSATDLGSLVHAGGVTDAVTLTWSAPGPKVVQVAVSDGTTQVTATQLLTLTAPLFGAPALWLRQFGYAAWGWTSQNSYPRFLGDVNGDGRADVVGCARDGIYVALSDGTALAKPTLWTRSFGRFAGWTSQDRTPRFVADMNGDHKADLVGWQGSTAYVALSTGRAFGAARVALPLPFGLSSDSWASQDAAPRFLADVTGDGKADLVGCGASGVYVAVSRGPLFARATRWLQGFGPRQGWLSQERTPRFLADVNGDGKADLVGFGTDGVYVALSMGKAFATPSRWLADLGVAQGWASQTLTPRLVGDVTGDGKADLVACGLGRTWVARSTGTSFLAPTFATFAYSYGSSDWPSQDRTPRALGDLDGDGRLDIVGFASVGVMASLSH